MQPASSMIGRRFVAVLASRSRVNRVIFAAVARLRRPFSSERSFVPRLTGSTRGRRVSVLNARDQHTGFEHRSTEISIVSLTSEHVDATTNIITRQFCGGTEPVITGCGLSYDEFYPYVHLQCQRTAENGLSTVCLIDGEVAAACLSEDFQAPTVPEGDLFYSSPEASSMLIKFALATELLKRLHHKLFADHPEWADGRKGILFHQWMGAVSDKFTRRGLCSAIMAANLHQGAAQGFTASIAECTGKFSLAAALNAGYVERHRIMYAEFEFNGCKPFYNSAINTGHTMCVLCTKYLK